MKNFHGFVILSVAILKTENCHLRKKNSRMTPNGVEMKFQEEHMIHFEPH